MDRKGLSEEVAENKAVEQMGSPIKLGQELNKLHKLKVDWFLIGLLVAAMGLGFLPVIAFGYTNDVIMNKVIFVILGVVTAFGMMLIDYRKLENGRVVLHNRGTHSVNAILFSERFVDWRTVNKNRSY